MEDVDADALRLFLAGRSYPCPLCGYDLRGLASNRCPECGRPLRLLIADARPVHAPFIAGVAAFAAPLGASTSGIVGMVTTSIRYAVTWEHIRDTIVLNSVVFIVSATALGFWLRCAGAIRRKSYHRQWVMAAAAWACTFAGLAICLLHG